MGVALCFVYVLRCKADCRKGIRSHAGQCTARDLIGGKRMKRLLVLGAEEICREFVTAARRERLEVITCSGDKTRMQEARGEHCIHLKASDKEAVLEAAMQQGVSGILGLGSAEAVSAAYAAQRLELPGIPYAVACLLHNRLELREFEGRHRFAVPGFCDVSDGAGIGNLCWPVCISAADDNTITGIELVYGMRQFQGAYRRAKSDSPHGRIIAEEYLPKAGGEDDPEGMYLLADLVIRGGTLQPMLFSECMLCRGDRDPVPVGCRYPARIPQSSRILATGECARLTSLLHLQDAELEVLLYMAHGRTPYILAVGEFLCGFRMPAFLSHLYGQDLVRDIVQMAVGEYRQGGGYEAPAEGTCMAYYAVRTHHRGILRQVRIQSALRPYIVEGDSHIRQSILIDADPTRGRQIGGMILRFPDEATMDRILGDIESYIEIVMDAVPDPW